MEDRLNPTLIGTVSLLRRLSPEKLSDVSLGVRKH